MCGIVGYAGSRPAAPILLGALRDLEYRGYDSAGIAVLSDDAEGDPITIVKRAGRIANLEQALSEAGQANSTTGIGHTRWATHGRPTDLNAHPHTSCNGEVVVIHNGIVENYGALRAELRAAGHTFASETDTETIAHLLEEALDDGATLVQALQSIIGKLEGSQAIVAMSRAEPGVLVAARLGNAGGVVVGYGEDEMLLASDLAAILPHTRRVVFLADGQTTRVDAAGATFFEKDTTPFHPEVREVPLDSVSALKGDYPHFMLKEIMEQPVALSDTIRSLATLEPASLHLDALGPVEGRLADVRRVLLLGMGTSLHAAMVGRRYIEELAGIPAEVDNASEFRYRHPILNGDTLVVALTQSGETVEVLEAMAMARQAGTMQVTVCNTEGSQTTRVADGTVYTRAGLERAVASTKAFTTALAALYTLALRLGHAQGRVSADDVERRIQELLMVPDAVGRTLQDLNPYKTLADHLYQSEHLFFLGRALAFPVAMEGALKMKEVSYIHAEGYSAGEMKHGPIALIDRTFPSVAIATKHALRAKTVSNIEQLQARGGPVVAVVTEGDSEVRALTEHVLEVPEVSPLLEPMVSVLPLQLLAYYVAVQRGCDVDQPRNLAKVVTVE